MNIGDRLLVRDRPWRVLKAQHAVDAHVILELAALDSVEPRALSVVSPPEELVALPSEELSFDLGELDSVQSWLRSHRILGATLVRETGLLAGARFGRVALEAYQLAPALRLLARPRASLLIADDVGLGKTIEAGLAMLELIARGRLRRVLIVTPSGLLDQWQEELREKFGLAFAIIENAAGLARVQTDLPAGLNPWDALPRVLTSVDFLKKETVRNRALRKRWDLVIVDEAHSLAESGTPQNPYRTQRTRLGGALREAARGLLLLTATPHNGYSHSFRSLLELVDPTLATFHGTPGAVARRVDTARIRRMKAQIRRRLPDGREEPVFPERTVLGIPVKDLDAREQELHRKVAAYCSRTAREAGTEEEGDLISFAMQIVKKRSLSSRRALEKTIEHRLEALRHEDKREAPPDRAEMRDLQAGLPLGDAAAERTAQRILRSAIPREERRRRNEIRALTSIKRLFATLPPRDSKLEALLDEIRAVLRADPDEKIIVFTEYLDTLAVIRERIDAEADLRGRHVTLTGGLSSKTRLSRQDVFEKAATRMLLATDAASEGLNLQRRCRRVIHFELPWNPNRLEQRNGRVDRYGQTRPPEIRYLFYPDSPEDDVLNVLVRKIEKMRLDRLSTPDILGVLAGNREIEHGLVELDPEADDISNRKAALVQHFEDRTAEFIRNVQPLVAAGDADVGEQERLLGLLNTAEPLLADDHRLEELVLGILGPRAREVHASQGIYRIEVPLSFRGPRVKSLYSAATFRRSVAVRHKADDVEFLTPLHPLVCAMAAEARRRLLQVYPSERGLAPRRLAVSRVSAAEPPSILFTFFGSIEGAGGLLEEQVLAIRIGVEGRLVGTPDEALQLLSEDGELGEVDRTLLPGLFEGRFRALSDGAAGAAVSVLTTRAQRLRGRRMAQAEVLMRDLETDLTDRLHEIDEDEGRARGLVEDVTGQRRLFGAEETRSRTFEVRRAAVRAQADARREEITAFAAVEQPHPPRPMGALLLVPAEARP